MHTTDTIATCVTNSPLEIDIHSAENRFPKEEVESILFFLQQENKAIDQLIEKMKHAPTQPQL